MSPSTMFPVPHLTVSNRAACFASSPLPSGAGTRDSREPQVGKQVRRDLAKSPPSSLGPSFSCLGGSAVEAAVLADGGMVATTWQVCGAPGRLLMLCPARLLSPAELPRPQGRHHQAKL